MSKASSASLEEIQKEYNMRKNPAKFQPMIQDKLKKIQDETKHKKRNAFAKLFNAYGQHIDMEHNAINYKNRNDDIAKMSMGNLKQIAGTVQSNKYNKDISRRQVEINDWYYQDKLETLFFLQLFFMTMLSMTIIFYFQKTTLISSAFAGFLTVVLLAFIGGLGLYRSWYTGVARDPRWWYKRRFNKAVYKEEKKCGCEEDPFVEAKVRCPAKDDSKAECISGSSGVTPIGQILQERGGNTALTALAATLAKDQQKVDRTAEDSLDRAQNALTAQTIAYMTGKNPPVEPHSPPSCDSSIEKIFPKQQNTQPGSTNVALNASVLPYF